MKKECKKVIENKGTCNQTCMFTNTLKRNKDIWYACKFQTFKHTNNQTSKHTNKKVRSKLERNKESEVIKYITNSKIKQPKTL